MTQHTLPLDDAIALSNGLQKGTFTSFEIVSAYLERIRQHDAWLHCFVEVYEKEALEAAKASDQMRQAGYALGPLHGLPIAVKDLVDIAGKVTTIGSPLLANNVAKSDAYLIQRLKAAGAIIIGKTHMVQFALGGWGTNEHMGTPRNPWDHQVHRVPGGSSSGSAAAVAGGLVPLSIGTDTGGSVRLPAAYCGITGFKFTAGAMDTTGVAPLSKTLDSIGVFAKSMAETALVYDALVDDHARATSARDINAESARNLLQGLSIGRIAQHELKDVQAEIVSAYESTLAFFKSVGAHITAIELPCTIADLAPVAIDIMVTEGAASYGDLANDLSKPMDSGIRPRLQAGSKLLATDYIAALEKQSLLKKEFAKAFEHIDLFATPTGLMTAVPLSEVNPSAPPVHFTRVLNVLDMCGVSVPVGLDAQHLPIGFQLGAAGGRDAFLIEVASAFQVLTRFHLETPKSHV